MIVSFCATFHHMDIQMNHFLKKHLFWGIWFFSCAIVNIAAVNVTGSIPYFKYKEIQKELPLTIPVKESEEGN